jgi:hypothetical protein
MTMYYCTNTFYSISYEKMLRWIKGLGHEKRATLKDVRAIRSMGIHVQDRMPRLLADVEWFEAALVAEGAAVGADVVHAYLLGGGPETALMGSEIRAVMDDKAVVEVQVLQVG